jgi:aldose 1-epimerase
MKMTMTKSIPASIAIENDAGLYIRLSSYGAAIREIRVPDRDGVSRTVTLAPTDEERWQHTYHGKTIGRTAGRIANATFTIGGRTAHLEKNNRDTDNLHGGSQGFHTKNFAVDCNRGEGYIDVSFTHTSADGEGGYFGNVTVTVTYRIYAQRNAVKILFDGTCDEATLLDLTNHVYWNLSGDLRATVEDDLLFLNASRYGVPNERLIVEQIAPVPPAMDFRTPHKIGQYIESAEAQRFTCGYDHVYFLDGEENGKRENLAAQLHSDLSGISLTIKTTYPCGVFYTNNFPEENAEIFSGVKDGKYMAACIECQYPPDGIHQSPDRCGILTPDSPYHEEIEYSFSDEFNGNE